MSNNPKKTQEVAVPWEAAYASTPNHYRELAEHLIQTGEVGDQSTFADARKALEKHNAVSQ